MPRYIALLRGVNVGKGNRLPMAEFRSSLEALGCKRVHTLLNSGNAVFSHSGRSGAALARRIHAALLTHLGLDLRIVVLTANELGSIIEACPLHPAEEEYSRLLVVFAQDSAALQGLAKLGPLLQGTERLHIGPQAAYFLSPDGLLQSKAASAILGKAGRSLTTRNWATVLKLGQLL